MDPVCFQNERVLIKGPWICVIYAKFPAAGGSLVILLSSPVSAQGIFYSRTAAHWIRPPPKWKHTSTWLCLEILSLKWICNRQSWKKLNIMSLTMVKIAKTCFCMKLFGWGVIEGTSLKAIVLPLQQSTALWCHFSKGTKTMTFWQPSLKWL